MASSGKVNKKLKALVFFIYIDIILFKYCADVENCE